MKRRLALFTAAAAVAFSHSPRAQADALSDAQAAYINQGFGMFVHFSMPTFVADTNTPNQPNINVFNPYLLNTDQWAATAKAAGMKYIVFTAKHEDGFALWNTPESSYNVTNTTWARQQAPGQADIISRLQASCDKYGLKLGLYFSDPDLSNGIYKTGVVGGNELTDTLDVLPNPHSSSYNGQYAAAQISELVALDPKAEVIWTDNYNRAFTDDQTAILNAAVKAGNPARIYITNQATYPSSSTDVQTYENVLAPATNTFPAETHQILGDGWFYGIGGNGTLNFTPQQVANDLNTLNGRGASYLLDVQVDRTGMIVQNQVDALTQTGQLLGVQNAPVIPSRPVRPAANLTNPVRNGTFDPNAPGAGGGTIGGGWSQHGNVTLTNNFVDNVVWDADPREDFAIFKPDAAPNATRSPSGDVSQTITTVPGQQYYVFFRLGVEASNTGNAGMRVSATGAPANDFWIQNDVFKTWTSFEGRVFVNWAPEDQVYTFTATSTQTTLDFLDITDYNPPAGGWDYTSDVTGVTLDGVAVAPVPEPTCLALVGLGCIPLLRRNRRSR